MDDKSGPTTREEFEAGVLANLEALGIDTQKYPVHFIRDGEKVGDWRKPINVSPNGSWTITHDALKELIKTPSPFTEQWERKIDKMWEVIARHRVDHPPAVEDTLAKLKTHIVNLSVAQTKDPALKRDTLLATHIVNLGEAYQALAERVQQLKHIEPAEETTTAKNPGMSESQGSISRCFEDLALVTNKDTALWDQELYDDIRKLLDAYDPVYERIKTLKPKPSEHP